MGSGKGNPEYWVAVVKPGRMLFEVGGVSQASAEEALRRAGMKMPMDVRFVAKEEVGIGFPEPKVVIDLDSLDDLAVEEVLA